jgi:hypothetical protein
VHVRYGAIVCNSTATGALDAAPHAIRRTVNPRQRAVLKWCMAKPPTAWASDIFRVDLHLRGTGK